MKYLIFLCLLLPALFCSEIYVQTDQKHIKPKSHSKRRAALKKYDTDGRFPREHKSRQNRSIGHSVLPFVSRSHAGVINADITELLGHDSFDHIQPHLQSQMKPKNLKSRHFKNAVNRNARYSVWKDYLIAYSFIYYQLDEARRPRFLGCFKENKDVEFNVNKLANELKNYIEAYEKDANKDKKTCEERVFHILRTLEAAELTEYMTQEDLLFFISFMAKRQWHRLMSLYLISNKLKDDNVKALYEQLADCSEDCRNVFLELFPNKLKD